MPIRASDEQPEFFRVHDAKQALQVAIRRWEEFLYGVWQQTQLKGMRPLAWSAIVLRVAILIFAGALTAIGNIEQVDRIVVTILSAVVTVLAAIEGYLQLAQRKSTLENRNRELLMEREKLRHEWMVKVELEIDENKALEEAKKLLGAGPAAVEAVMSKFLTRAAGDEPNKPGSTSGS
jgi:hypothetical protein